MAFAHGLKDTPTMLGSSGSAKERKLVKAQGIAGKQVGYDDRGWCAVGDTEALSYSGSATACLDRTADCPV